MLVVICVITGSTVIVLVSLKPKQHLWMNLFAMIAKDNSKVLNKKNFIAYADNLMMKASAYGLYIFIFDYTYSFRKEPLIRNLDSQISKKKFSNSFMFLFSLVSFMILLGNYLSNV